MNSVFQSVNDFVSFILSSKSTRDYAKKELNAILWVALITITSLLIDKVLKLFRLWSKASKIPGPPCDSFFGHNHFGSRENFIDLLAESHDKYGSVCKLWLGPTQLLVSIKDPVFIKEMLLKAKDKLPFVGKAFRLAFGRSSLFFCSYDQEFQAFSSKSEQFTCFASGHVAVALKAFAVGLEAMDFLWTVEAQKRRESLALVLKEKMNGKANAIPTNVVDSIMERIDANMNKGSVDCKLVSQHMAFTILGNTLFGDAFLAWSKATFYEELLMMIAKDASIWASYRVSPFWKQGFRRYQSLCTELKYLTLDIVQQCRRNYELFYLAQNSHNETVKVGMKAASGALPSSGVLMQDKFLSKELDGHLDAEEELCGNIMGVMFHGCIATASLIGNVLERLIENPEIQDKIYSEIMKVKQVSIKEDQNVDKMLLLLATIYESARLQPAGPLLQRCSLKDDLSLKNGVIIPAGAVLVVPAQLLHMDKASWGSDASEFNPYRFMSKAGGVSDSVQGTLFTEKSVNRIQGSFALNDPNDNASFLPFGSGIRACVGQKFVIRGVATLFASLLEHFEIRLHPGLGNDPKSTTGPPIVFERRNN